jgi:hypothetical protein
MRTKIYFSAATSSTTGLAVSPGSRCRERPRCRDWSRSWIEAGTRRVGAPTPRGRRRTSGAIRPGLLDTPSTDHTLAFVLALFGLGSRISKILRASMHSSTARRWGRAVSRATPVVAGFLAAYSAIASGGVTTDLWFVVVAAVFILAEVAFILFKLREAGESTGPARAILNVFVTHAATEEIHPGTRLPRLRHQPRQPVSDVAPPASRRPAHLATTSHRRPGPTLLPRHRRRQESSCPRPQSARRTRPRSAGH